MRRQSPDDTGFTMVEVVVAMLVFAAFSAFAVSLQLNLSERTRNDARRLVAANLATRQLEILRSTGPLGLADGRTTVADKPVINGTQYTLVQDVRFVASPDGSSLCAGSTETLAYKLVTVEVTWPGMRLTRPVRTDTLRSVGIGKTAADVTKGTLAVRVTTEAGLPQSGIRVTLSPSGAAANTGADGCAVFPNLATTSHTATIDQAPMVGLGGTQAVSKSTSVVAGKVARVSFVYEPRGSLAVTTPAPTGYALPAGLPVSFESSRLGSSAVVFPDCGSSGPSNCVSGTPRTAAALFPGTYAAWPGPCARPANVGSLTVASGSSVSTTSAPLGALRLLLRADDPLAGGNVYAYRPSRTGCTGTESYLLAVTTTTERRLALMPGTWQLATRADGSDAATVNVSVTITSGSVTEVQR